MTRAGWSSSGTGRRSGVLDGSPVSEVAAPVRALKFHQ